MGSSNSGNPVGLTERTSERPAMVNEDYLEANWQVWLAVEQRRQHTRECRDSVPHSVEVAFRISHGLLRVAWEF